MTHDSKDHKKSNEDDEPWHIHDQAGIMSLGITQTLSKQGVDSL